MSTNKVHDTGMHIVVNSIADNICGIIYKKVSFFHVNIGHTFYILFIK